MRISNSDGNLPRVSFARGNIRREGEFDKFMKVSEVKYKEKMEMKKLKDDVDSIKSDIEEIKSLLISIVKK